MKRILFTVFALAAALFTQMSYAADQDCSGSRIRSARCAHLNGKADTGQSSERIFRSHRNVIPFIPADVVYDDRKKGQFLCTEQGVTGKGATYGSCDDFVSKSTNTNWRMRHIEHGTIEHIFRIANNGKTELHVQFAGNQAVSQVVTVSPEAERIASANGYQLDSRTSTMVAINSGSVGNQQTAQSVPSAPAAQQVPEVALVDCNKLNGFVAKAQCFANGAAALGVLKKP